MRSTFLQAALIVLCVSAAPLEADVYRWVDEQGQVHFGDRSREQTERGTPSYSAPTAQQADPGQRMQKTRKLLDAYQAERRQTRDQKEKQRRDDEARQRRCVVARDRLKRFQTYGAVYRLDKEGNRVYLSDEERAASLQRIRDQVAKYCKS